MLTAIEANNLTNDSIDKDLDDIYEQIQKAAKNGFTCIRPERELSSKEKFRLKNLGYEFVGRLYVF